MRVNDRHADIDSSFLFYLFANISCGLIWVFREQQNIFFIFVSASRNIGMVNACVGAYESKFVFNDDRPNTHTQDFIAFLNASSSTTRGSFSDFFASSMASGRWRDSLQDLPCALRFADDLLRNDKNIVVLQFDICFLQ